MSLNGKDHTLNIKLIKCVAPEKIFIPCQRRVTEIPRGTVGAGGSERGKSLKGRGVTDRVLFPLGLKCDEMNTIMLSQSIQVTKPTQRINLLK